MKKPFSFAPFQLEDYARLALHDGAVLGHDTGTGKSLAQYALPLLWCGVVKENDGLRPDAPVLLVVPADGHDQARDEARKHFGPGTKLITLDSQATFLRLSTPDPRLGTRQLPPGYYLTSYTELTGNGVRPYPTLAECLAAPLSSPSALDPRHSSVREHPLGVTPEDVAEYFTRCPQLFKAKYALLQLPETATLQEIEQQWKTLRAQNTVECINTLLDDAYETLKMVAAPTINDLTDAQLDWLRRETVVAKHRDYSAGIGTSRSYPVESRMSRDESHALDPRPSTLDFWTIKCCYDPSLADLSSESFACVCVDEGTKMKGEFTQVSLGVRQMNPRHRLVLTATPIKNRLPDAFSLLAWAANAGPEGNARFPYGDNADDRESFAKEYLLSETNLTKEAATDRRCVKQTPQVTNIHRLWKLFAPLVLRRRKKDCGLAIVPKHRHVIRCPLGKHQAEVYKYHLAAKYIDKNKMPAVGAKLTALRVVAANPASALLQRPPNDDQTKGPHVSRYGYVPKLASVLNLLRDLLSQNEQALVFSAFNDSLDELAARLKECGVSYVVCDGRMTPKQRGRAAQEFKRGKYQVMLAGVESMAELHSFSQCSHVLLMCYSWAFDKFEQAINRVHRMDSPKDVHVWAFLCDGSIDGRLEGNIQEKTDSVELVLDGQLLGEQPTEVNLWDLLRGAEQEFKRGKTALIDENELEKQWPPLRSALARAARDWRFGPSLNPPQPEIKITSKSKIKNQAEAQPATCNLQPSSQYAGLDLWAQAG